MTGHSHSTCLAISSYSIQSLHLVPSLRPILCNGTFSLQCPVYGSTIVRISCLIVAVVALVGHCFAFPGGLGLYGEHGFGGGGEGGGHFLSLGAGPTYVAGPSAGSKNLVGPQEGPSYNQGPSDGPHHLVGPKTGPTSIVGPSQGTSSVIGPTQGGANIVGPVVKASYGGGGGYGGGHGDVSYGGGHEDIGYTGYGHQESYGVSAGAISHDGGVLRGPITVPVVIKGASGKIVADGLYGLPDGHGHSSGHSYY